MPDEREFRIGDVQSGLAERGPAAAARARLDEAVFPTLAALLKLPASEFRARVDALAERARQEGSGEVQQALQTAVRLLPELKKDFGG